MTNKEKALERFGFTHPDKCIKTSQCVGCRNNEGRTCKVFGQKPMQYARATAGTECPRKEAAKR